MNSSTVRSIFAAMMGILLLCGFDFDHPLTERLKENRERKYLGQQNFGPDPSSNKHSRFGFVETMMLPTPPVLMTPLQKSTPIIAPTAPAQPGKIPSLTAPVPTQAPVLSLPAKAVSVQMPAVSLPVTQDTTHLKPSYEKQVREVILEKPQMITATRQLRKIDEVGRSVSVVTRKDIQNQNTPFLSEILRGVMGLRVKQSGGRGQLTTIRMRGMRSTDTQLRVDGVPLYDAADPQGSANPLWGNLMSDGFQRVEVLRGPASVLYGSSALAGVIHLIPKEPVKPLAINAQAEMGSQRSRRENVELEAKRGPLGLYGSVTHFESEGNDPHDGHFSRQELFRGVLDLWENAKVAYTFMAGRNQAQLNEAPVITENFFTDDFDDENDRLSNQFTDHIVHFEHHPTSFLEQHLRIARINTKRRALYLPNTDGTFEFEGDNHFTGNVWYAELENDIQQGEWGTATLGYHYEQQGLVQFDKVAGLPDPRNSNRQLTNSLFAREEIRLFNDALTLAGGVRHQHYNHHFLTDPFTWEFSSLAKIPDSTTRLKGNIGTGFRAPSLYERYGTFFNSFSGNLVSIGNPDLKPEKTLGWDVGIEKDLFQDRIMVGSSFFRNDIEKAIDFVNSTYSNLPGDGRTRGIENQIQWHLAKGLDLKGFHTYQSGIRGDGEELRDVPRHLWGMNVNWVLLPFWTNLDVTYRGNEKVSVFNNDDFTVATLNAKAYYKCDLSVGYPLRKDLQLYVRADNLFNAKYKESGFNAPGTLVMAGVRSDY